MFVYEFAFCHNTDSHNTVKCWYKNYCILRKFNGRKKQASKSVLEVARKIKLILLSPPMAICDLTITVYGKGKVFLSLFVDTVWLGTSLY